MSDSAFIKRVNLLEFWTPSLLLPSEELYDLADCILSVWETAEQHTEERIVKLLESYWDIDGHQPFESEHCQDCGTIGDLIELIKKGKEK